MCMFWGSHTDGILVKGFSHSLVCWIVGPFTERIPAGMASFIACEKMTKVFRGSCKDEELATTLGLYEPMAGSRNGLINIGLLDDLELP